MINRSDPFSGTTIPVRKRRLAAVATAVVLVTVSACSSSSGGPAATNAPKSTDAATTIVATTLPVAVTALPTTLPITLPPTVPRTTPAPDSTDGTSAPGDSTSGPTPDEIAAVLQTLLLTPADIGPSFIEAEWPGPADSTPCGVNVDDLVPYGAITGILMTSESLQLALVQSIRRYEQASDAEAAFATGLEGLGCGSGQGVTIGDSVDLTDQLGVTSVAFQLTGDGFQTVLILAVVTASLVTFQFQGAPGAAEAAGLLTPVQIADIGMQRILDFVNS